jgi:tagatose 1,6-diphosphate aldolase
MDLSPGKLWGLRRLADAEGFFRMTALDQRPPIMNLVRQRRGLDHAPDQDVADVKRVIAEQLAPLSSAVLVDPIWAYPAVIDLCPAQRGVILTLEDHRFEDTAGGRRSSAIPAWSVEKIRRIGGDAVKVLAWYRPDAASEVVAHQQQFVREVGEACAAYDLPFVLELLVYPFANAASDYVEDPGKRPELVLESVRTFADPGYGVDLFKLESPVPAADVPEPGSAEAQALFDALGRAAGRPWVMLSAGASQDAFKRVLHYAYRAGASGFLAGRAIWWQAFQRFPDLDAMRAELAADGAAYMRELEALTRAAAQPWSSHPCYGDSPKPRFDLPERYPGIG